MNDPERIGEAKVKAILRAHGEWFRRKKVEFPDSLPTGKEFVAKFLPHTLSKKGKNPTI